MRFSVCVDETVILQSQSSSSWTTDSSWWWQFTDLRLNPGFPPSSVCLSLYDKDVYTMDSSCNNTTQPEPYGLMTESMTYLRFTLFFLTIHFAIWTNALPEGLVRVVS